MPRAGRDAARAHRKRIEAKRRKIEEAELDAYLAQLERARVGDLKPYHHGGQRRDEYRVFPDGVVIQLLKDMAARDVIGDPPGGDGAGAAKSAQEDNSYEALVALRAGQAEAHSELERYLIEADIQREQAQRKQALRCESGVEKNDRCDRSGADGAVEGAECDRGAAIGADAAPGGP
ncbi:hypothetical protein KCG44_00315 [Pacificimonas sp. WHA3]|uniref:Uncharacterized protein n=1 Tax=Pacificimonas pallii TaxID=2827236 RepID=A0ABS6SA20_9SPHN|nr:hypothetical protein [Pacificimonas pallii]MBV7255218.1 hypothetical protein [Pacificimonas pallii]